MMVPQRRPAQRLIQRLKERKVVEWALAYLGGAWLALEVVDLLGDNLGWPSWVFRSVMAFLSVGFFGAVVLAWYHGKQGRQRVRGSEVLILAGLLIVGGAVVATVTGPQRTVQDSDSTPGTEVSGDPRGEVVGASAPVVRSLAVLPLRTIASDPDTEPWFAEGITELLTAELSTIGALTVISRTSAMPYEDREVPWPEIARQLGVDGLLDGSVFLVGDEVRLTLQLVHGPSGRHLWSDSYQRPMRDVLGLQAEVATTVAEQIEVTLSSDERHRLSGGHRPVDPQAYQSYLRARSLLSTVTPETHARALPLIQAAIEADSSWAAPFALLAEWHLRSTYYGVSPTEAGPKLRTAALAAVQRDSMSAEAHLALGQYYDNIAWEWDAADAAFRRALALNPSDALAHLHFATSLAIRGGHDEAIEHARRAVELDPLSNLPRGQLAFVLQLAGRYEEAEEIAREAIALDPGYDVAYYRLVWALFEAGRRDEAVATMERTLEVFASGDDPRLLVFAADLYAHAGQEEEARALLGRILEMTSSVYVIPPHVASIYVGLGENDEAIRWLRRAYETRDPNLTYLMVVPRMRPLREEPGFQELVDRLDMPETAWR